ncbi:hypothetical protein LOAG_16963 [Loa loa]|uniref:Uncharacterized protein n=1 Tax=Loa loa TaxID=7209 RepID=A0A1S0UJV2_LOALO|nr:hypothetical protein LOAG_16963 [Loa loa]EJD76002.1 hypothetical protein LOAG_16963 [Loa loa]
MPASTKLFIVGKRFRIRTLISRSTKHCVKQAFRTIVRRHIRDSSSSPNTQLLTNSAKLGSNEGESPSN